MLTVLASVKPSPIHNVDLFSDEFIIQKPLREWRSNHS